MEIIIYNIHFIPLIIVLVGFLSFVVYRLVKMYIKDKQMAEQEEAGMEKNI